MKIYKVGNEVFAIDGMDLTSLDWPIVNGLHLTGSSPKTLHAIKIHNNKLEGMDYHQMWLWIYNNYICKDVITHEEIMNALLVAEDKTMRFSHAMIYDYDDVCLDPPLQRC